MSEFGERVRNNKLTLEEAVPSSRGRDAVATIGILLVMMVLLLGAYIAVNPPAVSVPGLSLLACSLVVSGTLGTFMLDRCRREHRRQWWYRNFIGCCVFHGFQESGEHGCEYGTQSYPYREDSPLRSCSLVVAVRLGGWFASKLAFVPGGDSSNMLPPWNMARADSKGWRLRIADRKSRGERGRMYLPVSRLPVASLQWRRHRGASAATWCAELLEQQEESERVRQELERLIIDTIELIRDTQRLFHSKDGGRICHDALQCLLAVLPFDHPRQAELRKMFEEVKNSLANRAATRGKKGEAVTPRKGAPQGELSGSSATY